MRYRLTGLTAKIEGVEGTDSLPVIGTDGIQLERHIWNSIETDYLEQNDRQEVAGQRMGRYGGGQPSGPFVRITAVTALKGTGAAYAAGVRPEQDVLHRIAGLAATVDATAGAETIDYEPRNDDAYETASVYAYTAGMLFKVVACRARITSIAYVAAQVVLVTHEILGRLKELPTEVAMPAIAYPRVLVKPPVLQQNALTLNGFGASFRSATFDQGAELVAKPRGGAAGGHAGYELVDFNPSLVALIDRPSLAAFNPWALRESATDFAWSLTHGATQYNRTTLSGPGGQIVQVPPQESEGLAMLNLRIRLNHVDPDAAFQIRYH
jgi:hypothetical protein